MLFFDQKSLQWVHKPEDRLETFQASKMELFTKIIIVSSRELFWQKVPSSVFDWVLNPLTAKYVYLRFSSIV